MPDTGPFHEGEVAVQERTGERELAARRGAMIRDSLAAPMPAFLASQRTLAVGVVDSHGNPWASLWLGAPGFITVINDRSVRVLHAAPVIAPDDPARGLLTTGCHIGLLAIDLATRRRLRINGIVAAMSEMHVDITIHEVFPNCPKYIQQREWTDEAPAGTAEPAEQGDRLDGKRQALVKGIDTLFVASRHPARGIDVSHRGGARGFVRVLDENTLQIPDYPGNGMFQTLGNFDVESRAGVLMVDFEHGRFLSLSGHVNVVYGSEKAGHPSGGTGRYWQFSVTRWTDFPMHANAGYRLLERSPFNPVAAETASANRL